MSKPYLTFHGIASIQFGPIRDFVKGDPCLTGDPFCTRRLTLTDKDGTTYHFSLYADRVEQLEPSVDAAIERHKPEPAPVCAGDKHFLAHIDEARQRVLDGASVATAMPIPPAIDQVTGKEIPW